MKLLLHDIYSYLGNKARHLLPEGSRARGLRHRTNAPLIVAHRGYHVNVPENTVEAFLAAAEAGFQACECDIWETCRDQEGNFELVVNHDPTFSRVFGYPKNRKVYEMTADEIRKGLPDVCFLEDFLRICREQDMIPFLEFKYDFDAESGMSTEGIRRAVRMVAAAGFMEQIHVISFHPGILSYAKEVAESIPSKEGGATPYTAYLISGKYVRKYFRNQRADYFRAVQEAASRGLTACSMNKNLVTADIAGRCRAAGMILDLWTYERGEEKQVRSHLREFGAASVTVNDLLR